ncbi:23S rRNA (guanosine(2251)-2'-O)-methyltransferase [hydrothermal vent metagenome]|uniref:23S rRNA (Guanosine(2251)-2'-O)-methyltransferase n=1 Tax=hydrothermal vent metagenome TaxID=652676 RepID=A0A3B0TTI7_9ZZZZ
MIINQKKPRKPAVEQSDHTLYIYGLHSVAAALGNEKRQKHALYATPNALKRLKENIGKISVEVEIFTPRDLDKKVGAQAVHQGLILKASPLPRLKLSDLDGLDLLVVLDQITDPHNVGAILRSAAAFGANGVITTARYAPDETGVLAKSASGALDLVPFIEVNNLGEALIWLKKQAVWCLGLDSGANESIARAQIPPQVALVLGSEGKGLRLKTRQLCNQMVALEMPGAIKSLNVSNAAAIALFALSSQTGTKQP